MPVKAGLKEQRAEVAAASASWQASLRVRRCCLGLVCVSSWAALYRRPVDEEQINGRTGEPLDRCLFALYLRLVSPAAALSTVETQSSRSNLHL